jgi:hypothetical protein
MTTVTRLTNTGNLLVNGSFDELSLSSGSISLNGTNQYVTAPANSKFNLTGDFTVEGWYWIDSTVVESRPDNLKYVSVFSGHGATSGTGILEVVGNATVAGTGLAIYQDNPSIILSVSTTIPLDSWVHLAFVRTGTTIYGFVNGTRFTLGTSSASFISGTNPVAVGRHLNTSYNSYFKGYVTNVRVVKGTALYTANFIPSLSILPAVANTSLLLNVTDSSNFIKDNSENKFTLTNFNSSTFNVLSPFNTSNSSQKVSVDTVFSKQFDEVSLAAGSINFEGSEYILVNTTNDSGNIGTGDFTWEAWVYPINFSTDRVIYDGRDGASQNSLNIRLNSTTGVFRQQFNNPSTNIDGTAVQANTWTHLAITRSGTTLRLFQNGVITNTVVNSTSITNGTNRPIIGASGFSLGNASFLGYISNVRLIKGQALYTADFIPSQTVPGSTANTSVILNVLNSTDFRKDNGPYNFSTSVSGTPSWSAFGPFNNNVTGLVERRLPNATLIKGQFDEYTGAPTV